MGCNARKCVSLIYYLQGNSFVLFFYTISKEIRMKSFLFYLSLYDSSALSFFFLLLYIQNSFFLHYIRSHKADGYHKNVKEIKKITSEKRCHDDSQTFECVAAAAAVAEQFLL